MGAFADRVFAVVKQIPRGKVATYGQIARIIGAPRVPTQLLAPNLDRSLAIAWCSRVAAWQRALHSVVPRSNSRCSKKKVWDSMKKAKWLWRAFFGMAFPPMNQVCPWDRPAISTGKQNLLKAHFTTAKPASTPAPIARRTLQVKRNLGGAPRFGFILVRCAGLEPTTSGVTG